MTSCQPEAPARASRCPRLALRAGKTVQESLMTSAEIVQALEEKFDAKIKSKKTDTIDPFVVVDPTDLLEVCRFLRDDSRLRFEMLNCISGVDYLELDPKKAPKAGFEPHLEV